MAVTAQQKKALRLGVCAAGAAVLCLLGLRVSKASSYAALRGATSNLSSGAESCDGRQCPASRCDDPLYHCGDEAPYQCLDGSARFGCNADESYWMSAVDTLCGDCCDARTCDSPAPHLVGGDKDAGGCLVAAGYQWCASKKACVRTWETPCPDA